MAAKRCQSLKRPTNTYIDMHVTLALAAAIFSNYCASNLHINAHTKTKQAWSTTLSLVSEAFFTSPFIAQTGTSVLHEAIEGPQSLASTRDPESAAELATPPLLMMNTIKTKRCRILRPASYQQLKPGGTAVWFHIDVSADKKHIQYTPRTLLQHMRHSTM